MWEKPGGFGNVAKSERAKLCRNYIKVLLKLERNSDERRNLTKPIVNAETAEIERNYNKTIVKFERN